jgi:hypothetical protein
MLNKGTVMRLAVKQPNLARSPTAMSAKAYKQGMHFTDEYPPIRISDKCSAATLTLNCQRCSASQ